MGEEQRLSPEEQLRTAREAFEAGTDFTVAVEEEFALLDGDLELVNRFEDLQALAAEQGLQLGSTGTHPWARWQDQRIIDTPHYRRNDEILRYVVWRNNTFGLHVHVGI